MTACIEATGPRHSHGYRYLPGGSVLAHRAAYEAATGEVLGADEVGHTCGNFACIEPSHLLRQPPGAGVRRGNEVRTAGQRALTECVNGHGYTPENTRWRGPNGAQRDCKACVRERGRRSKAKKRAGRAMAITVEGAA